MLQFPACTDFRMAPGYRARSSIARSAHRFPNRKDALSTAFEAFLPPQVIVDCKGQSQNPKATGESIVLVLILGAIVVDLVPAARFESWIHPIVPPVLSAANSSLVSPNGTLAKWRSAGGWNQAGVVRSVGAPRAMDSYSAVINNKTLSSLEAYTGKVLRRSALSHGAMCPREAAMNSGQQKSRGAANRAGVQSHGAVEHDTACEITPRETADKILHKYHISN